VEPDAVRRYHSRVLRPSRLAVVALLAPLASAAPQSPWHFERPLNAGVTGRFADPRVDESSGVAASRRSPGVLWTHNDSGDGPYLYATDTAGAALGTFVVTGARNADWEDIALGPCGSGACLYIADTGDNREQRRAVMLYRVPEPDLAAKRPLKPRPTAPAEAVTLAYPDGPHDVEAMWVAPNQDVHLVTKARSGPVRHYRVPAVAWASHGLVTAELLEQLPLEARSGRDRVTGAGLSPDGRSVAVRTYSALYFFRAGENGRLDLPAEAVACDVRHLGVQGEGLSWLDDSTLVLTSERGNRAAGTIAVARCALPRPVAGR
jgi:hypothetical protein